MGVINVLDKHIAELIAAGEVVERPSSVIKELIENSIDAKAKNITVEIKNGGTTFIRVNDDGYGIMKDDVRLAFLRHATSKVKRETDLDSISTLGFRGEALASISSVSRLQLITRSEREETGSLYEINGGDEAAFSDAGCPVGTTFIIRDLFYNVPARMKFLKKDVAEGNAVSAVIDKAALSHPEVAFTYIRDGRQALKTSGDGKLMSAIYSVFGKEFAEGLIPVNYELNGIVVKGYVSKPVNSRPNRNMQNFFINGRFVKTRTASIALEEACKGSIMAGKFPSCVLHLKISFEAVDVNVHPSKVEVRFINERPVYDAVYHAVKSALLNFDGKKDVKFKNNSAFNDINTPSPFSMADSVINRHQKPASAPAKNCNPFDELNFIAKSTVTQSSQLKPSGEKSVNSLKTEISRKSSDNSSREEIENYLDLLEETPQYDIKPSHYSDSINTEQNSGGSKQKASADEIKPLIDVDSTAFRYIGEAFKTYIIIEKNGNELLFIDKHAAHERMIYEKLKKDRGAGFTQMLLTPVAVTLNKTDYNAAVNNIELFRQTAFEIEDFGNGVLLVRGAPQYLDESDIVNSVEEMAAHIAENKMEIESERMDWIYHNVSCRAAIKAGNKSTPQELIEIAMQVDRDPALRYCPHGRPTCITISKREIEKQFGRV